MRKPHTDRSHRDTLKTWLAAERQGSTADAERALVGVLRFLPLASPSPGFAARVMQRIDAPRPVPFPQRFRLAIAACLALTGLGLAWLAPALFSTLQLFDASEAIATVVRGAADFGHWLSDLYPLWDLVARLRGAMMTVVATPQVTLVLVVALALASLGLRGLMELLTPQRSPAHVQA